MTIYKRRPLLRLEDCQRHGPLSGAELYIVEGESAAKAVCNLRDPEFQAVLPMQGKPANAAKASRRMLQSSPLFNAVKAALGYPELVASQAGFSQAGLEVSGCRYQRIILLFDPDADGIHCGALMLIYFYKQFKPLLEAGMMGVIRAPLVELTYRRTLQADAPAESLYAYTDDEAKHLQRELTLAGMMNLKTNRTRGLGGMPSELLSRTCLKPTTRHLFPLRVIDAQIALAALGGA